MYVVETMKKVLRWKGWRRIFFPHPLLVAVLTAVTLVGLPWVFLTGRDNSPIAYLLYPVSAYALVALCARLPRLIRVVKAWADRKPIVRKLAGTKDDGAFGIGLYAEQLVNLCYGGFKLISGIVAGSVWLWTDGLYNALQGTIQLYQILRHRQKTEKRAQWQAYRRCGYGMIALNLTMIGLIFQMIHLGAHEEATEISIIATAAFTFYKLTMAIVDVAKDRKHKNPVDSAVRFLDFGQALYNLFVLQVGLLWVFGGEGYASAKLLNSLTGGAVCLLVMGMGIYMVWRSHRDMKRLEAAENENPS